MDGFLEYSQNEKIPSWIYEIVKTYTYIINYFWWYRLNLNFKLEEMKGLWERVLSFLMEIYQKTGLQYIGGTCFDWVLIKAQIKKEIEHKYVQEEITEEIKNKCYNWLESNQIIQPIETRKEILNGILLNSLKTHSEEYQILEDWRINKNNPLINDIKSITSKNENMSEMLFSKFKSIIDLLIIEKTLIEKSYEEIDRIERGDFQGFIMSESVSGDSKNYNYKTTSENKLLNWIDYNLINKKLEEAKKEFINMIQNIQREEKTKKTPIINIYAI